MQLYLTHVASLLLLVVATSTDSADITAIYRLEGNHFEKATWDIINNSYRFSEAEIYLRTSALGKDITAFNGQSVTRYPDGPHFPSCYQHYCDYWRVDNWELTLKDIDLSDYYEIRNGLPYTDTAACSDQYRMSTEGIFYTAYPKLLGNISSPNWPGTYYHNIKWEYYMYTHSKSRVTLKFDEFDLEPKSGDDFDYLNVYDGRDSSAKLMGTFYSPMNPPILTSHGENMYAQFHSNDAIARRGFFARYYDDPHHSVYVYKLHGKSGSLRSPKFTAVSENICIGVTYLVTCQNGVKLQMILEKQGGSGENIGEWTAAEENKWLYRRFIAKLNSEDIQKEMSILINGKHHVDNCHVFIKLIQECNPYSIERVIQVNETCLPTDFYKSSVPVDSDCINGGKMLPGSGKCVCPVGFTGDYCDIGCGANKYGEDCRGECSWHNNGCKGLVMCKEHFPCDCAPGFKGDKCQHSCGHGEYGTGCKQKCAECAGDESCDPYTGACNAGCKEGYYPPLCFYKYKYVMKPPTISSATCSTLTVEIHFEEIDGRGKARFFEVQYKKNNVSVWSRTGPELIPSDGGTVAREIKDLSIGTWYNVRAILIDEDLSSYHGDDVPFSTAQTECLVPESINYDLQCLSVSHNNAQISWQYDPEMTTACPILSYEVYIKGKWSWTLYWNGTENRINIVHLYPGKEYTVKVRGITVGGAAKYSDPLKIFTRDGVPGRVSNLRSFKSESNKIHIGWDVPSNTAGYIRYYSVKYKCASVLGCPDENCNHIHGEVRVMNTQVTVRGLLPHSQYLISVAAVSGSEGLPAIMHMSTDNTVPDVTPAASEQPIVKRTNSSFVIQWNEPESCTFINGFISHYQYELYEFKSSQQVFFDSFVLEGSTRNTSVAFNGLKENTDYTIKIYLVTSGGFNPERYLIIQGGTKKRVPDAVQHLTVYEKSRKMIGIRWASPKTLYGSLHSFTVTYSPLDDATDNMTTSVKPVKCVAWPHLYCYTITSLTSDTRYTITVSARNSEIPEDGDPVSISAVTKEGMPKSPVDLEILQQSETSIKIKWSLPYTLNGILRKFHLHIKQTNSSDMEDCCSAFPIEILSARVEQPSYKHEFTGLNSASTYIISVSAKTTVLGPAAVITGYTKPHAPSMEDTIDVISHSLLDSTIAVKIFPVNENTKLIKGYLLLVFPENNKDSITEFSESYVRDTVLANELRKISDEPFYIAAEFQKEELNGGLEVLLGTGHPQIDGRWVTFQDPHLVKGAQYRIAFVILLQYSEVYSISHTFTPIITVK